MRQAKRASQAQGAGESGLDRLIQMHFFNTAGDAAVAISLAGSLFFQVPSGEARGQVALFLGPDDAPLRDRRAADRAVPRPVRPRAALGDRLDDGDPRLPVLGPGRRRRHRVGLALPCRARGARRIQGVRRHARGRRTPAAAGRLHPGQGQRPGLDVGHRRRRDLRTDRGPGLAGRLGVGAALRLRALRDRHDRGDPAAGTRRLQPGRGRAGAPRILRGQDVGQAADPHPTGRRLRAARQLRATLVRRAS